MDAFGKTWRVIFILAALVAAGLFSLAQSPATIPFDSPRWTVLNGKAGEHLGRPAFLGTAFLKDAVFENGVIEFDIAVTGARSYPGVAFRSQPDGSWERVYIRPHRAGVTLPPLYPDVVQYVPSFNRVDSWQLYNGEGFTAPAPVPAGQWVHVKIEVKDTQARVFLGAGSEPALKIHRLVHGRRSGGLGLMGPADGTAWFSNFAYRADDALRFDPPPPVDAVPGVVSSWQISKSFKFMGLDMEKAPVETTPGEFGWKPVTADPSGLVDIARISPRTPGGPDVVFAKATLHAEKAGIHKYDFGYSDVVRVFLNGQLLYGGDSIYGSRDPSFLGIVGYNDTLALPLRQGDNELILAVAEVMGGWGFLFRDGEAVFAAPSLSRAWETGATLRLPESVAYDPARKSIYVSNYDPYTPSAGQGRQFITRLSADGKVDRLEWVKGLFNPTGLCLVGDKLFVVEPSSLVEIDVPGEKIANRYPVDGAAMLNDVCAAPDGALYVSDSAAGVIFRFANGKVEAWAQDPALQQPNGVRVLGGKLLVGVNSDNCLKAVDLATKSVSVVAPLGPGIIDGIEVDENGAVLVSHNAGRLFRVTLDGKVTKLLDTSVSGRPIADFTYVPALRRLIIPTFQDNRVEAWDFAR